MYLAGRGSEVSLVVRGPDIATEMSAYLVDRLLDVHSGSMKRAAAATGEGASASASVHKALAMLGS